MSELRPNLPISLYVQTERIHLLRITTYNSFLEELRSQARNFFSPLIKKHVQETGHEGVTQFNYIPIS
jgi:hypothetical protein